MVQAYLGLQVTIHHQFTHKATCYQICKNSIYQTLVGQAMYHIFTVQSVRIIKKNKKQYQMYLDFSQIRISCQPFCFQFCICLENFNTSARFKSPILNKLSHYNTIFNIFSCNGYFLIITMLCEYFYNIFQPVATGHCIPLINWVDGLNFDL